LLFGLIGFFPLKGTLEACCSATGSIPLGRLFLILEEDEAAEGGLWDGMSNCVGILFSTCDDDDDDDDDDDSGRPFLLASNSVIEGGGAFALDGRFRSCLLALEGRLCSLLAR
jgi:hypothetical protein